MALVEIDEHFLRQKGQKANALLSSRIFAANWYSEPHLDNRDFLFHCPSHAIYKKGNFQGVFVLEGVLGKFHLLSHHIAATVLLPLPASLLTRWEDPLF